jgi:hypothetical protein
MYILNTSLFVKSIGCEKTRKIDVQGDRNIHCRKYGTTVLICSDLYNVTARIRPTLLNFRIVEANQIVKI